MPSTTTSNAACSATAAEPLSWFSSRPPRRLISAYSTRKKNSILLLDLICLLYHPAANERSFRSRLDNHSQHDRVRAPRGIRRVGYPDLRDPQRQPSLPRGRLSSAR